jgi:hypothetical protein
LLETVTASDELATVDNCRVADSHTYFVGDDDWAFALWAHNASYTVYKEIKDGVTT